MVRDNFENYKLSFSSNFLEIENVKFFLYILLFICLNCIGQANIETPFGFPKLHIEMTTEELTKEMGEPIEIKSFNDENKVWIDGGYDTKKAVVYAIGFDQVYVYEYQNKYCLWKAYIKENKIIYMNLSGRYVMDKYKKFVTVRNQINYGDSAEKVEAVLGKNFFPDQDIGYTDYLYPDLGIRFTFAQNKISNIYLFRPFSNRADLFKLTRYYR